MADKQKQNRSIHTYFDAVDAVTDRRTEAVTDGRLEAVLLRSFDVATEGTTETVTNGRLIMKEQSAD